MDEHAWESLNGLVKSLRPTTSWKEGLKHNWFTAPTQGNLFLSNSKHTILTLVGTESNIFSPVMSSIQTKGCTLGPYLPTTPTIKRNSARTHSTEHMVYSVFPHILDLRYAWVQ